MKKKIVNLVVVILLISLAGFGCIPKPADCESQLAGQRTQLEAGFQDQLAEQRAQLEADYGSQLAELEEVITTLEVENESLRAPTPKVSAKVVGTITFKGLIQLAEAYFTDPKVGRKTSAWTKGPYPLVSLETLKAFLGKDDTDKCPPCRLANRNICDEYAFRLKDRWIRAGLPGHSLSLIKREKITGRGMTLYWSCIFITKEEGQFIIYEVVPYTDEIIRLEKPDTEVYYVLIADRL